LAEKHYGEKGKIGKKRGGCCVYPQIKKSLVCAEGAGCRRQSAPQASLFLKVAQWKTQLPRGFSRLLPVLPRARNDYDEDTAYES